MKVEARGLAFDVDVAGPEDGAAVLLLHGFPQLKSEWDRVTALLHVAGRSTITVDQRGYSPGARPTDVEAYGIGELVADAVAILDALNIETADVVGHDWGAVVGWHLAAEHADRVRTYTAVSVPHPTGFGAAIENDEDQKQKSAYIGLFRQPGKAEDLLLEDDGMRLRAMFFGCPPELIDGYVKPMLDRGTLTAALNWYRAMHANTMVCGVVSVPTTFVWGDRDGAIGATAARSCTDYALGDFRFVQLHGVGHWVPDEAPEELTAAILDRIK